MNVELIFASKYPGKEWVIVGNPQTELEYEENVTWMSKGNKPSWTSLVSAWPEVEYQNEFSAVERIRQAEYIKRSDPLFFQWQRGTGTKEAWLAEVELIKDENPYPVAPAVS